MIRQSCPICGGSTTAQPAMIAGFVVERCGLESERTLVRYCAACDFAFFERRLTVDESARLYADYRGDDYNAQRLRHEPDYAPLIPVFADPLSEYYRSRIAEYAEIVALHPEMAPARVLDFGGDGSIARRLFPAAHVEFDDLAAGTNPSSTRFDVIFASQVFEHLTDPAAYALQLAARLAEDGMLIADVPIEYKTTLSEGLLLQRMIGGSLYVMHEHINQFSLTALGRLCESAGLAVVFAALLPTHSTALVIAGRRDGRLARELAPLRAQRELRWEMMKAQRSASLALREAADAISHKLDATIGTGNGVGSTARDEIAALRAELGKLTLDLRALVETQGNLSLQYAGVLDALRDEVRASKARNEAVADEIAELGSQLADQVEAAERAMAETARVEARVQALLASHSWRVTAPLRWLSDQFRSR